MWIAKGSPGCPFLTSSGSKRSAQSSPINRYTWFTSSSLSPSGLAISRPQNGLTIPIGLCSVLAWQLPLVCSKVSVCQGLLWEEWWLWTLKAMVVSSMWQVTPLVPSIPHNSSVKLEELVPRSKLHRYQQWLELWIRSAFHSDCRQNYSLEGSQWGSGMLN